MALTYKIKNYRVDSADPTKTYVGFTIIDENKNEFLIDKLVTTGNKTQAEILTEAKQMSQAEIDEWQEGGIKDIGKTWDPETGLLERK